ncbi:MAG TPA: biopolymer transporter ExbD [Candidatus Hydrogenedentes bacterium]|nr:biopolymer transporter ExbD [Candidatus Hydrogenedentota bacterium]
MKFPRNNARKIRASVELTPLIDVVFQLLIFFMLSSTFIVQTSVPIELPKAEGAENLESKKLTITLVYGEGGPEGGGEVYANDTPIVNWTQLTRLLVELRERETDPLVLIRPDARVPTERLVKVLGLANSVGIKNYGIAAAPPEEE